MPEAIRIGGMEFEAAWVRCQAQASFKPEEAFVKLAAKNTPEDVRIVVELRRRSGGLMVRR